VGSEPSLSQLSAWPEGAPSEVTAPEVLVDTSTPAFAAESFLDAWRKRSHQTALELSVGDAHTAVLNRMRSDELMSAEERAAKQKIWNDLATTRLSLMVDESENLPDGRVVIHGTAEGEFLDRPYAREIDFVTKRVAGKWKVEDMQLRDITSDVPDFLEIDPSVTLAVPPVTIPASRRVSLRFPISNDPVLLGLDLWWQGLDFDLAAPARSRLTAAFHDVVLP